jgi:hypothetical protein
MLGSATNVRRRSAAGVLAMLSWGLAVGCGLRVDRGTLPDRLSDQAFWALVTSVSEAPGAFPHSDNLVSNEILIPHTLRQLHARGGVYIGVGPEQNFSYIARIEPAMAFIIDIRQENRNLHLLYKALFELSENRVDFVSRLFSRERPDRLDDDPSVDELFEAYHSAPPSPELLASTRASVEKRLLETHRVPLSPADLEWIDHALNAFYREGPDIDYGASQPMRDPRPSYRELMTAADVSGQSRSYLATDKAFVRVKALHERNLIVPVVGDFGTSDGAIARVGEYVQRHGSQVSAFYSSNVEVYLSNQQMIAFCRSLASLPLEPRSAFILSKGTTPIGEKLASCPNRSIRFF